MFIQKSPILLLDGRRKMIDDYYRLDEGVCVEQLLKQATISEDTVSRIKARAASLIAAVREQPAGGIEGLMAEYDLSSDEGVALMCLAESLLRIPDAPTVDSLIKDKIIKGNWEGHRGKSSSAFVNWATWWLMTTGKLLSASSAVNNSLNKVLSGLISRSSEPIIRQALKQAMRILSQQFVLGRTIEEAIKNAQQEQEKGYLLSYDMLGEAARTASDVANYFAAYEHAIEAIANGGQATSSRAGISIKLSALHARFSFTQRERCLEELAPRLRLLVLKAKEADISIVIDAEQADVLDLSLDLFDSVFSDPQLDGWEGLGIAVQAYQKRAMPILNWLRELSVTSKRKVVVRLVKGAYWDTEIKLSQELGLKDYPVFTRKRVTDLAYLVCVKKLFAHPEAFIPQFATHNAYSLATVLELAGNRRDFECQRLQGMGGSLYDSLVGDSGESFTCRIYAPVGNHNYLLSYLARRLLENSANNSFVNRANDESASIEELTACPIEQARSQESGHNPQIVLPHQLYGDERTNSQGLDLSNRQVLKILQASLEEQAQQQYLACPIVDGKQLPSRAGDAGGRPFTQAVCHRPGL